MHIASNKNMHVTLKTFSLARGIILRIIFKRIRLQKCLFNLDEIFLYNK